MAVSILVMGSPETTVTGTAPLDAALRALADASRRTILNEVHKRPRAVGEIADEMKISQQAVSHHLSVLRRAGLVSERREGTRHLFALKTEGFAAVQGFLDEFWPRRLSALKHAAEAAAREGRDV